MRAKKLRNIVTELVRGWQEDFRRQAEGPTANPALLALAFFVVALGLLGILVGVLYFLGRFVIWAWP